MLFDGEMQILNPVKTQRAACSSCWQRGRTKTLQTQVLSLLLPPAPGESLSLKAHVKNQKSITGPFAKDLLERDELSALWPMTCVLMLIQAPARTG